MTKMANAPRITIAMARSMVMEISQNAESPAGVNRRSWMVSGRAGSPFQASRLSPPVNGAAGVSPNLHGCRSIAVRRPVLIWIGEGLRLRRSGKLQFLSQRRLPAGPLQTLHAARARPAISARTHPAERAAIWPLIVARSTHPGAKTEFVL